MTRSSNQLGTDICFASAKELARLIHAREISVVDVLTAFLGRIGRVNPAVNAICTLVDEDRLIDQAREADLRLARRDARPGPLQGFPLAIKDLVPTAGIRTTFGSRVYRDFVPVEDGLFVQRLKAAGAIVVGKTNTPEFGAGSQTFNAVFGATRNPYDLTRTCGGSSGGAAVALATGMVPLADGSDLGGSLRNPASFCNVVGFRPSPGRVPTWPSPLPENPLAVEGPMGRSVEDVARLLAVMAGPDPRVAISLDQPGGVFLESLDRDVTGTRIAWSRNLGRYPVEAAVTEVCERARPVFRDLGCIVEDRDPDVAGADEAFQILRAWMYAETRAEDLARHPALLKDTVVWNIEKGLALREEDVRRAEATRGSIVERFRRFFDRYDFLVLPVVQVVPFPIEMEWVRNINGIAMETYLDWMATCYVISLTGSPAISVPAGFTPEGLPVGLQIVGRRLCDMDVLRLAHAFERATQFGKRRPPVLPKESRAD